MAQVAPKCLSSAMMMLCAAMLLALVLAGCSNKQAIIAADHAKCREIGFHPGTSEYDVCLLEVQRRRTALAAEPEQLRE